MNEGISYSAGLSGTDLRDQLCYCFDLRVAILFYGVHMSVVPDCTHMRYMVMVQHSIWLSVSSDEKSS